MLLIPVPQKTESKSGNFRLLYDTGIILDVSCDFSDFESAQSLQDEIYSVLGYRPAIVKSFAGTSGKAVFLCKGSLDKQAYTLDIDTTGIRLCGGDGAGLFYGVQTLRQLVRQYGNELPCVFIEDSPSFPNRGFYHDITRGKVPTLDTLKELADRASFYKLNQIQLYIEHTFAFKNYSEIWRDADPITAEEIIILDEYCKRRHIELVPSLSTFGHLYHALSTKTLSHLCELEVDFKEPFSWGERMRHHTLDVSNPGSIEFVKDMLDEFIPLFTSGQFNICCDETFDLGEGRNRELAQKVGKSRLYLDFLKKIMGHVQGHGKKVMFWGDIVLEHPESLTEIPKDVICLNWDYEAIGTDDKVRKISELGIAQYVCPGVLGWNRFMNDIGKSWLNIEKMVSYGRKYGAEGVLNTDWGDFGHINLFANSIPGMIFGAEFSWNAGTDHQLETECSKISQIEFGDSTGTLVGILKELGGMYTLMWDQITFWNLEKVYGRIDPWYDRNRFCTTEEEYIMSVYRKAVEAEKTIIKLSADVYRDRSQDMEEFIISARGIALQNALILVIKKYHFGQDISQLVFSPGVLAGELENWLADYSRVWRARNKESELFRIRDVFRQICNTLRDYSL